MASSASSPATRCAPWRWTCAPRPRPARASRPTGRQHLARRTRRLLQLLHQHRQRLLLRPPAKPQEPVTWLSSSSTGPSSRGSSPSSSCWAARCPSSRCRWSNTRSEEHTSELQSPCNLVCRLLLEKKKIRTNVVKNCLTSSHSDTTDYVITLVIPCLGRSPRVSNYYTASD